MHTRDIHKALQQLDSENDAHWTVDGAPRIDAVADLGLSGMTREILTTAAPLFSRTHRELPDLDAMRAEADKLAAAAIEAERVLREAKAASAEAARKVATADRAIEDSHKLTRQNQAWIESQNKVQKERIERGKAIDELVKSAGGPKMLGKHPIEVSEAARIKAARRNYKLPAKPEAR